MGCVPSSDARNSSVDTRASTGVGKPQKNVELQTKSAANAEKSTVEAPKTKESEMDRDSNDKITSTAESSPPVAKEDVNNTPEETVQDESTDTDAASKVNPSPLVIDTKPLESFKPKPDPKAESDELMLDFKTFVLIPEVQQVLDEGSVKADMLQDLFDIVDKDADGFVNDIEREDLLELISLSYGAKSKPTTPLNRELDPLLPPVPTLVLTAPVPAPEPVEPKPAASAELEAAVQTEAPATETKTDTDTETETETEKEGATAAAEENAGGVSPLTSEASTSTKSGKRKPKIIKFISPELVVPNTSQQGGETKGTETPEAQAPTTPTTPTSSSAAAAAKEETAKDLPPQKKGFMVTRRERESFGSRDSSEQGQSRFFVLDHGTLSFMDSTSRKPPFSMTHREIALKGVDVQVKGTAIELTPLASASGSADEEEGAEKEIVILELKNEKECAVWMDAIKEHMKFFSESE